MDAVVTHVGRIPGNSEDSVFCSLFSESEELVGTLVLPQSEFMERFGLAGTIKVGERYALSHVNWR